MSPVDEAIQVLRMAWAQGRPVVVAVNPGSDNFQMSQPKGMTPHDTVILVPGAYFAYVAPKPATKP